MKGQITIFDYLKDLEHRETEKPKELNHVGDWIDRHGKRVMFADVKIGGYYIADYSTYSRKNYKIVYVKNKKDDAVMYVDRPKGVTSEWSWGNSFSALTRQEYMDADRNTTDIGMADTAGWWYEVPEDMEIDKPAEIYPVDIVGICDDAQCPKCGYGFMYPEETDKPVCPKCGIHVDWTPWHRMND